MMDADEVREEIAHQQGLQQAYRKRLRALELQAAMFDSGFVPSHISIEISELQKKIQDCNDKSTALKVDLAQQARRETNNIQVNKPPQHISLIELANKPTRRSLSPKIIYRNDPLQRIYRWIADDILHKINIPRLTLLIMALLVVVVFTVENIPNLPKISSFVPASGVNTGWSTKSGTLKIDSFSVKDNTMKITWILYNTTPTPVTLPSRYFNIEAYDNLGKQYTVTVDCLEYVICSPTHVLAADSKVYYVNYITIDSINRDVNSITVFVKNESSNENNRWVIPLSNN